MSVPFLTYLLCFAGGLGILHLVCSARPNFPHVGFLVFGAFISLVAGLYSLHGVLAAHVERSALTAIWWPIFGMGFMVVGGVVSLAWLGLAKGLPCAFGAGKPAQGERPQTTSSEEPVDE